MAQHPFTPEPHEPEPWPERVITPWEWAGGEAEHTALQASHVLDDDALEALWHAEAEEVDLYRRRGFSVGFGVYVAESPWVEDETS